MFFPERIYFPWCYLFFCLLYFVVPFSGRRFIRLIALFFPESTEMDLHYAEATGMRNIRDSNPCVDITTALRVL
jgi:hypothetical protein